MFDLSFLFLEYPTEQRDNGSLLLYCVFWLVVRHSPNSSYRKHSSWTFIIEHARCCKFILFAGNAAFNSLFQLLVKYSCFLAARCWRCFKFSFAQFCWSVVNIALWWGYRYLYKCVVCFRRSDNTISCIEYFGWFWPAELYTMNARVCFANKNLWYTCMMLP